MTKFRLNKINFGKEVLCSKGMEREMKRRAQLVMARAVTIAPVGRNDRTLGNKGTRYKDSFSVSSGVRTVPPFKTRRAYGQVGNSKSYALHVEYGVTTKKGTHTNKHRVLGRALDAARG